jgi:hypothetical protein
MAQYAPLRLNSARPIMVVSSILGLAGLIAVELHALSLQLDVPLDPLFCSPSSLHNVAEPPDTPLSRDYVLIRQLLRNPNNQFELIERIYGGALHAPTALGAPSSALKRADRARLIRPVYHSQTWTGSLREEASRIDAVRGTHLSAGIERGLQDKDAQQVATGLRQLFAMLLDELLQSVEQRVDSSVAVSRGIRYARRYYQDALEAYLTINSPAQAAQASAALEAMSQAGRETDRDRSPVRKLFMRERANFTRAVREGLEMPT